MHSPPPPSLTIASRAQEMKIAFLGLSLTLASLLDPTLPILATELRRAGLPPNGDMPFILRHDSSDPEFLNFNVRDILTRASQLHGEVLGKDLMSTAMSMGATRIGFMIIHADMSRKDIPILQFARHFRNACAHGDRWEFKPGQPETPASCRHVVLDASMAGRRATYETVTPRLYVEFLDDISNYFVPGYVPPQEVGTDQKYSSR